MSITRPGGSAPSQPAPARRSSPCCQSTTTQTNNQSNNHRVSALFAVPAVHSRPFLLPLRTHPDPRAVEHAGIRANLAFELIQQEASPNVAALTAIKQFPAQAVPLRRMSRRSEPVVRIGTAVDGRQEDSRSLPVPPQVLRWPVSGAAILHSELRATATCQPRPTFLPDVQR